MGGEFGNETFSSRVFSIGSTKFHLDRIFLFLHRFFFFRLEKLVLLSLRGYLDEIESEKTRP